MSSSKEQIIDQLKAAQQAHIEWQACAEALVDGLALEKEQIPLIYTTCQFGQWYYSLGQCLSSLPTFLELEEPHKVLHHCYHQIFLILFGQTEHSFLTKIFGNKQKLEAEKYDKARLILPSLDIASKQLVRLLRLLETEIITMSDERFNILSCR